MKLWSIQIDSAFFSLFPKSKYLPAFGTWKQGYLPKNILKKFRLVFRVHESVLAPQILQVSITSVLTKHFRKKTYVFYFLIHQNIWIFLSCLQYLIHLFTNAYHSAFAALFKVTVVWIKMKLFQCIVKNIERNIRFKKYVCLGKKYMNTPDIC